MLQAGADVEEGEVHVSAMFADRTVRRRFDKKLRDTHARRDRSTQSVTHAVPPMLMRREAG